eukprot:5262522-Pleurochrysis_carterae.AAC.3
MRRHRSSLVGAQRAHDASRAQLPPRARSQRRSAARTPTPERDVAAPSQNRSAVSDRPTPQSQLEASLRHQRPLRHALRRATHRSLHPIHRPLHHPSSCAGPPRGQHVLPHPPSPWQPRQRRDKRPPPRYDRRRLLRPRHPRSPV